MICCSFSRAHHLYSEDIDYSKYRQYNPWPLSVFCYDNRKHLHSWHLADVFIHYLSIDLFTTTLILLGHGRPKVYTRRPNARGRIHLGQGSYTHSHYKQFKDANLPTLLVFKLRRKPDIPDETPEAQGDQAEGRNLPFNPGGARQFFFLPDTVFLRKV